MKLRASALAVAALAAALVVPAPAGAGGFCSGYGREKFVDVSGRGLSMKGNVVHMKDNCFKETVLRVSRGATVQWVNGDAESHTVGGTAGTFGDMHAEIEPEGTVAYRFDEEGIFPYVCLIHPGMAGAIVVGDGEGPDVATVAAQVPPAAAGAAAETSSEQRPAADAEGSEPPVVGVVLAVAFLVILAGVVVRLVLGARGSSVPGRA